MCVRVCVCACALHLRALQLARKKSECRDAHLNYDAATVNDKRDVDQKMMRDKV
jgi:hypothetical protein